MKTLYVVKRRGEVLLETYSLKEATTFANANCGYVEWLAVY